MKVYKDFEEWMDEIEGFSLRQERAYEECKNPVLLMRWLRTAWELGYEAGQTDILEDQKYEFRNPEDI